MIRDLFKRQDFCAGLMFLGFGIATLWFGSAYPKGTASAMGPGYFPLMLGSLLSFLGFVITVRGIVQAGPQVARAKLRPFLMIAAVVGFGILLPYVGLVLAIFVLIVVGAVADTQFRFVEVLVLAAVMSVFCIAVFDWGLGLHIPIWPRGGL